MNRENRIRNPSTLSFMVLMITLFITNLLSVAGFRTGEIRFPPYESPTPFFTLVLIIMIIASRGLFFRVKIAYYVAILSIILLFLDIFGQGLYYHPLYIPITVISVITFAFMIIYQSYYHFPTRFFDKPDISISFIAVFFVLLYGVFGSLLLGSQFSPHIRNFVNALYYTGEVVSTLGFGDIIPNTPLARVFTVSLAFIGLGTFFGATTVILAPLIYNRGRRVVSVIDKIESSRLENYIIFLGYSPLLKSVIKYMKQKDELVVVALDSQDQEAEFDGMEVFLEYERNMDTIIERFNLQKAAKIILANKDDGKNLINAISIRKRYGNSVDNKLITVVNDPNNAEKVRSVVKETIDPSTLLVQYFEKFL